MPIKFWVIGLYILPVLSYATLGENLSSINSDNQALASCISLVTQTNESATKGYVTSIIKTTSNVTIKEFSFNNKVFAISWKGQSFPNVNQLTGSYFPQIKTSKSSSYGLTYRKIMGDDFVFITGGLPGKLFGITYIPSLVPNNVDVNNLK